MQERKRHCASIRDGMISLARRAYPWENNNIIRLMELSDGRRHFNSEQDA